MKTRAEEPDFFDLSKYPFAGNIGDGELRDAFAKKFGTFVEQKDPAEILSRIGKGGGWSPDEVTTLADLPTDSYYEIFKNNPGEKLRSILTASLQFGAFGNASDEMKQISERAKEALQRIGRESEMNAMRVRRYGVNIDEGDKGDAR